MNERERAKMEMGVNACKLLDDLCVDIDYYTPVGRRVCDRFADKILSIKGIAILSDDQTLPPLIDRFKGQVKRVLMQANFRRIVNAEGL